METLKTSTLLCRNFPVYLVNEDAVGSSVPLLGDSVHSVLFKYAVSIKGQYDGKVRLK